MAFCLPDFGAQKLLDAIKNGSFDPDKVYDMTSAERRTFLESIVGKEDAAEVNAQIESKMLLKDWQRGMATAVRQLTGLTEKAKTDYISKIQKMDKLLSPADEKSFYADITAKKLGTAVTLRRTAKTFKPAVLNDSMSF